MDVTKNLCRACLTEEGLFQSIFLEEISSDVPMHISEMLNACATIPVNEGDGLPDQICSECSEMTIKAYLFKIKCQKSDIVLRERLKKGQSESPKELVENESDGNSQLYFKKFENNDFLTNYQIKQEDLQINEEVNLIQVNNYSGKESEENVFLYPDKEIVFKVKKDNLNVHSINLNVKKEFNVSFNVDFEREKQLLEINPLLKNRPRSCNISFEDQTATTSYSQRDKGFSRSDKLGENKFTRPEKKLTNHKENHSGEKQNECDICKRKFTQKNQLRRHERTHTGEKRYEYDICKKKFTHSESLSYHKIIHMDKKSFECDICKKKFVHMSQFKRHERTHTGEKPYKCDICMKKFAHLASLSRHQRLHTGEKPYECDICNKKFARRSELERHKRTHTGEKPYECVICKRKFSQLSNLNTHKRLHTLEKPNDHDYKTLPRKKNGNNSIHT